MCLYTQENTKKMNDLSNGSVNEILEKYRSLPIDERHLLFEKLYAKWAITFFSITNNDVLHKGITTDEGKAELIFQAIFYEVGAFIPEIVFDEERIKKHFEKIRPKKSLHDHIMAIITNKNGMKRTTFTISPFFKNLTECMHLRWMKTLYPQNQELDKRYKLVLRGQYYNEYNKNKEESTRAQQQTMDSIFGANKKSLFEVTAYSLAQDVYKDAIKLNTTKEKYEINDPIQSNENLKFYYSPLVTPGVRMPVHESQFMFTRIPGVDPVVDKIVDDVNKSNDKTPCGHFDAILIETTTQPNPNGYKHPVTENDHSLEIYYDVICKNPCRYAEIPYTYVRYIPVPGLVNPSLVSVFIKLIWKRFMFDDKLELVEIVQSTLPHNFKFRRIRTDHIKMDNESIEKMDSNSFYKIGLSFAYTHVYTSKLTESDIGYDFLSRHPLWAFIDLVIASKDYKDRKIVLEKKTKENQPYTDEDKRITLHNSIIFGSRFDIGMSGFQRTVLDNIFRQCTDVDEYIRLLKHLFVFRLCQSYFVADQARRTQQLLSNDIFVYECIGCSTRCYAIDIYGRTCRLSDVMNLCGGDVCITYGRMTIPFTKCRVRVLPTKSKYDKLTTTTKYIPFETLKKSDPFGYGKVHDEIWKLMNEQKDDEFGKYELVDINEVIERSYPDKKIKLGTKEERKERQIKFIDLIGLDTIHKYHFPFEFYRFSTCADSFINTYIFHQDKTDLHRDWYTLFHGIVDQTPFNIDMHNLSNTDLIFDSVFYRYKEYVDNYTEDESDDDEIIPPRKEKEKEEVIIIDKEKASDIKKQKKKDEKEQIIISDDDDDDENEDEDEEKDETKPSQVYDYGIEHIIDEDDKSFRILDGARKGAVEIHLNIHDVTKEPTTYTKTNNMIHKWKNPPNTSFVNLPSLSSHASSSSSLINTSSSSSSSSLPILSSLSSSSSSSSSLNVPQNDPIPKRRSTAKLDLDKIKKAHTEPNTKQTTSVRSVFANLVISHPVTSKEKEEKKEEEDKKEEDEEIIDLVPEEREREKQEKEDDKEDDDVYDQFYT